MKWKKISGKYSSEDSNLEGDEEISFYYTMYTKYKMLNGMLSLDGIFSK